jgi:hypothetical protein
MRTFCTPFFLSLSFLLIGTGTLQGLFAQAPAAIPVYNMSDEEQLATYGKLDLDATHPNLLSPQLSEDRFEEVLEAWKGIHQQIGNHLKEQEFQWGSEAESISILHKIYFQADGQISHYGFRIMNPDVSDQAQQEFGRLLATFLPQQTIEIERASTFAQCGKTRYPNP